MDGAFQVRTFNFETDITSSWTFTQQGLNPALEIYDASGVGTINVFSPDETHTLNVPIEAIDLTINTISGSTLIFSQPFDTSGSVDPHTITKTGPGTARLSSTNTYGNVGGAVTTYIVVGSWQAGNALAFSPNSPVSIESSGILDLNSFANTISSLTGSGQVTLGSGILTINGGSSTTYSGSISGSGGGLSIEGGTSLSLTGSSNSYTGTTEIANGTLTIGANGALAPTSTIEVSSSGTLAFGSYTNTCGDLTSSGTMTQTGGALITGALSILEGTFSISGTSTIEPTSLSLVGGTVTNNSTSTLGSSLGNLTFSGGTLNNSGTVRALNYTQSGTSTLRLNLGSTAASFGNVQVANTATLGGTLQVNNAFGTSFSSADTYNLLVAGDSITGTFSTVSFENFSNSIIPSILYTGLTVELRFSEIAPQNSIGSFPQLSFIGVNEMNLRIGRNLTTLHSHIFQKRLQKDQSKIASVADFSDQTLVAANELSNLSSKKAKKKNVKKTPPSRIYIGPIASLGHLDAQGNAQEHTGYQSGGVFSGFEYAFESVGLGVEFDFSQTWGSTKSHTSSFTINQIHNSAYATWIPESQPALAVNGIAGWGYGWYQLDRSAGPSDQLTAKGSPRGLDADALFGIEYIFEKKLFCSDEDFIRAIPLVNLQYVYARTDGYSERGGGIYNLSVTEQNANSLKSLLGSRFDYRTFYKKSELKFEIDLGWQYEYLDSNRNLTFATFNIPGTQVVGTQVIGAGRNTFWFGCDFRFVKGFFELEASYDLQLNSSYLNNAFYFGLGGRF